MKLKKIFLCLLTTLLLFTLFSSFTMAQAPHSAVTRANYGVPPTGVLLKFTNYAYNNKVMNVYTDYTPVQGDFVTLWSPSGSQQQSWRSDPVSSGPSNTKYYIKCFGQSHLALNYNIATTKCTLWPWATNDPQDCNVSYYYGNYAMVMLLLRQSGGRFLGTSGSGNGAQLYWYANQTTEENWHISDW